MRLYLVRHAQSGPSGLGRDLDRQLTERGREQAKILGRGLKRLNVSLHEVLTSPAARAAETAEILARSFQPAPPVLPVGGLYGNEDPRPLLEAILPRTGKGDLAVVGHLPVLERFASLLVSETPQAALHFQTASAACLEFDAAPAFGQGRLRWLMGPDEFAALTAP